MTDLQTKMLKAFDQMIDEKCELENPRECIRWLSKRGFTREDCVQMKFARSDVDEVFNEDDDEED